MALGSPLSRPFGALNRPGGGVRFRVPRRGTPFTPYTTPTSPPAGTYDPALAAQARQGNRGLSDLLADTNLGDQRQLDDYTIATDRTKQDRQSALDDLATSLQREDQAYGTSTQNLARSYQNLASNQTDAARAAGVAEGGALVQALQKRTANQGVAQGALDTSHNQALADNATQVGRVKASADRSLADLLLNYQRGTTDRDTTLQRAQRENTFFGQDTGSEEFWQAAQGGYVAPGKPGNEYGTGASAHQIQTIGGHRFRVAPNGRILSRVRGR